MSGYRVGKCFGESPLPIFLQRCPFDGTYAFIAGPSFATVFSHETALAMAQQYGGAVYPDERTLPKMDRDEWDDATELVQSEG